MNSGKRGTGKLRKTRNFSLPEELDEYVARKADRNHGGNVSHYIRSLVQADRDRDEAESEQKAA